MISKEFLNGEMGNVESINFIVPILSKTRKKFHNFTLEVTVSHRGLTVN